MRTIDITSRFTSRSASRAFGILAALATPGLASAGGAASPTASPTAATRWTAATPDEMVDAVIARANRGGDDALAALVIAASLDERATFGKVRDALDAIAKSSSPLADEARWLRLRLLPDAQPPSAWPGLGSVAYDAPPDATGLVKSFAILGPFQDTGGGLMRREGPEAAGERWADGKARYSWGVYDVAWRRTLPASATARGLPLDLYIHPRGESCTYLASKVVTPANAKPMLVHVAASGAVRLLWDGADVAASEDSHPHAMLDRMSARIEPTAGAHLLALKVCTGTVADDGDVRVRFTDEQRSPLALPTSSDLTGITITGAPAPATASAAPVVLPKPSQPGPKPDKAPAKAAKASAVASTKGGGAKNAKDATNAKAAKAPSKEQEPEAASPPKAADIVPPKGITVLRTPLDRALDLGPQPTTEQILASAILRTQAGADDARSPRAPGLLDTVVRDPKLTPDELAMAGWVSPFGANRSGWLNLARTRAGAENDPATAAFAQRRLVATHIASRHIDWASSTALEEPLKSATDTEALLVRALVKRQLGASGLVRAAADDLLAIEQKMGDKTPLSALAELADAVRAQPDVRLRVLKKIAAERADARGSGYVSAFHVEGYAAVEKAAADMLANASSADELLRVGHDLLEGGRYAWAREVFFLATRLAPNRSGAFQGLASARQAVAAAAVAKGQSPGDDPQAALTDLGRARDLEPGDASLKAEIAFRSGGGSGGAGDAAVAQRARRDEQYLVPAATFLEAARQNPVKKGEVADRQLHWVRVVTYHADKRVSQLMHYSREIVVEPRTENELYETLPSEGDETELLLAKLHRKDGTVVMPEEQSSGGRKPFVRWPELKTGDVVEVAVRSWTAGPVGRRGDSPFYFIDYVGSSDTHPILYNEVVVDSPTASPLAIDVLNGKAERIVTKQEGDRTVTRYIWDHPPNVPDEPLAPKLSEVLPVVVGSTYAGWGPFREWYRAAVKGFTEPDNEVRRLAGELTKGKKTQDDKIRALFEFVADDIRYVNYVSGEWWLPNRPQELLARRQGDCDDKAMLLITLLKAIDVEASEVLIQTRYTAQPSLLRSEKVAIPLFDHGIAYLPGKGGKPGIWLDATSPESRLGPLPSMDARTVAMFVDEGPAKIIETPASSPDEHGIDAEWKIKLSPTGAGDLVATERHTGDAAFEARMNLKEADARAQWVEQYLTTGWFPAIQVTGNIEFKPDLPKGVARLSYGAHSDGLARREGDELAVPVAEASTITSQLAPLVTRTLPVVLPPRLAPGHETRTITITAPPGFVLADLPPGGTVPGGEFGKAKLEFKPKGKTEVVVTRSVVFDMSTIPVDKYAKWRSWLQDIDGLMHRTVRFVPSSTLGASGGQAASPNKGPKPQPGAKKAAAVVALNQPAIAAPRHRADPKHK